MSASDQIPKWRPSQNTEYFFYVIGGFNIDSQVCALAPPTKPFFAHYLSKLLSATSQYIHATRCEPPTLDSIRNASSNIILMLALKIGRRAVVRSLVEFLDVAMRRGGGDSLYYPLHTLSH
jgi:hypothetical protein